MNADYRNRELKKITLENLVILKNNNKNKSVYNQKWLGDFRVKTIAFMLSVGKGYTVEKKSLHILIETGLFFNVKPEIKKKIIPHSLTHF